MRERKYTLPRHTNLAKQGARTGAFFIDLAITLALTLGFFFGCFNLIFRPQVKPCSDLISKEQIKSHLYYEDKDTKEPTRIPSTKGEKTFRLALHDFYSNYLPGKILSGETKRQPLRDVEWFNKNILEIDEKNKDGVYTYIMVGENPDKTQIGVPKFDAIPEEVGKFIQGKYADAIISVFNEINFIKEAGIKQMNFNALSFVLSSFIGTSIGYVLIPWLLKNGQSVGKKIFKIGLSDSDGYKFKNKQLIMRVMPLVVCELSLMFLVRVNMYLVISIFLIIFLVSFGVAMASPKKMALHDYTARSMVVDLKTSIIFDDPMEEEKYLLEEDHILEEGQEPVEYNGEEPELKYEK